MNNVIKILSTNKDYRVAIADTKKIAERELTGFTGEIAVRDFLAQFITNCALLSGINDFGSKISVSLRLAEETSAFCLITEQVLSLEYSGTLNLHRKNLSDLFNCKSIMTVTTGDWQTGLHTGTVEAYIDNIDMLFSHFAVQSDQLPSQFIIAKEDRSRGILFQPLPFADHNSMQKASQELAYLSVKLEQADWADVPALYAHLGKVVSQSKIE